MHLSKSQYCSAIQCPKMLWLKKNRPEVFDDSCMNQAVLDSGIEVGKVARGIFGKYGVVPFTKNYEDMFKNTVMLIDSNTPIIADASFSWEGLFCRVDVLKNLGDRNVEIYEVKSSTTARDIDVDDISYQRYVLTQLGYQVIKTCIIHINNQYVRHGDLELSKLFVICDMSKKAETAHRKVQDFIRWLKTYMEQKDEPDDEIDGKCFTPYKCGFFSYCTRDLPKPNLFDLAGARKNQLFQCYQKGLVSYNDLYSAGIFGVRQATQMKHEIFSLPPQIEKDTIREFLRDLSFPLYFVDFETCNPAIPFYNDSRPYEQIVFQYSLHILEKEGGRLAHKEFLAYPGKDPRRDVAERLCKDIPLDACTLAYNMSFEKTRIKEMAELFPDLSDHLMNIYNHIQDLMMPFQKLLYYDRAMKGSYSVKYVLPALFPNEPTLDYSKLEEVHNGMEASSMFKRMFKMSGEELERCQKHLLKYCELDTFAMVKIWEKLREVIE